MTMLIGFIPFIAFAILQHFAGSAAGLGAAAVVSAGIVAWDLAHMRTPKVLEVGSAVIFSGLGLYALCCLPTWSLIEVHLFVHIGLLLIVLSSLAMKQPFTMAYARERTPPAVWKRPEFYEANRSITLAWAAAFVAGIAGQACMVWLQQVPVVVPTTFCIVALAVAMGYTLKKASESDHARHVGVRRLV